MTQQEAEARSKVAAEDLFARDLRENTLPELGVDKLCVEVRQHPLSRFIVAYNCMFVKKVKKNLKCRFSLNLYLRCPCV